MARIARPVPVKGKVAGPSLAARYPDWFALGVVSVAGGWEPLVDQLFADLAATLDKDERAHLSVAAVRERDGRLSVETYDSGPAAQTLIAAATAASARICQSCGAPGRRKVFPGWTATLCAPCRRRLGTMRIGG